jgi:hypothetical protein
MTFERLGAVQARESSALPEVGRFQRPKTSTTKAVTGNTMAVRSTSIATSLAIGVEYAVSLL